MERPTITAGDVTLLKNFNDLEQSLGAELLEREIEAIDAIDAVEGNNGGDDIGLGEGGRELLRSLISFVSKKSCVKGANLNLLKRHAADTDLWKVVQRIVIERKHCIPCSLHLKFITYMSEKKTLERMAHKKQNMIERPCKVRYI